MIARVPFDEEAYCDSVSAPALVGEAGYTTLERIWLRPTLDVNGLTAGFSGAGAKTIIPAVAMAKLSMRSDQDPDEIALQLNAYVKDLAPLGVTVSVLAYTVRAHGRQVSTIPSLKQRSERSRYRFERRHSSSERARRTQSYRSSRMHFMRRS